jgi:hypothetical protein
MIEKPIAIICPNGLVKFYHRDGTRNDQHPTGFYRPDCLAELKKDYRVIFQRI